MVSAYPPQLVKLIDTCVSIIKDVVKDREILKVCAKEVRAYDMQLRASLDSIRALNIEDEEFITLLTLVGGSIYKRDMYLTAMEDYINNKNKIQEILNDLFDLSTTMQIKTRTLSEKLKIIAPSTVFPVVDDFVDFYSSISAEPSIQDTEVSDLKHAVMGVSKGIIPITVLEEKFNMLFNKQESLSERMSNFPSDSDLSELKKHMEKQKASLVEFKNYFKDKDRERLTKTLQGLDENPDCLEKINEILSIKETSDQFIACFRCGEMNSADLQFCKKCKAALVFFKAPGAGN